MLGGAGEETNQDRKGDDDYGGCEVERPRGGFKCIALNLDKGLTAAGSISRQNACRRARRGKLWF